MTSGQQYGASRVQNADGSWTVSLFISEVQESDNNTTWYLSLKTSLFGDAVNTNNVVLQIGQAPTITTQPTTQIIATANLSSGLTFSVSASLPP